MVDNPPDITVMVDWASKIPLSNHVTLQNQTNMMQPVGQGNFCWYDYKLEPDSAKGKWDKLSPLITKPTLSAHKILHQQQKSYKYIFDS